MLCSELLGIIILVHSRLTNLVGVGGLVEVIKNEAQEEVLLPNKADGILTSQIISLLSEMDSGCFTSEALLYMKSGFPSTTRREIIGIDKSHPQVRAYLFSLAIGGTVQTNMGISCTITTQSLTSLRKP